MVKIDWNRFIKDRIWFGWWHSNHMHADLSSGWARTTTSYWTIIDRTKFMITRDPKQVRNKSGGLEFNKRIIRHKFVKFIRSHNH